MALSKQTMSKPSRPSRMMDDPKAKMKLIGVSVVLLLAVTWIIYTQMPGPRTPRLTGKAAETAQQENEKIATEIKEQEQKSRPPGVKPPPPPAGS